MYELEEALLFVLIVSSVPLCMIVYCIGEIRGAAIHMRDQRAFLAGSTWLWVDGHFYPVEPTAEQLEEVRLYEDARKSIQMSTILHDANVGGGRVSDVSDQRRYYERMMDEIATEHRQQIDQFEAENAKLRELVRDWYELAVGGADSLTDWNHAQADLEQRMSELGIEVDG